MYKKIGTMICVASLAFGLLVGCGKEEQEEESVPALGGEPIVEVPETSEEPEETAATEPTETVPVEGPATTITDRVTVDGKKQSYLTGEWKDEAVVNRRPMGVMMPNNKEAMPLWGISAASIIYEAPVEGRTSRLMVVLEDYDDLVDGMIGPIRSSRDYFVYEAMAYDAIYCNWGLAVPYVADLINSDRIDNISEAVSGIKSPSSAFFRRSRSGYATEFTGYMTIDSRSVSGKNYKGYTAEVENHGYQTTYHDSFVQAFTFAADGYPATYEDHESATLVDPGTSVSSSGYAKGEKYFKYDEEDGLYHRYQFGDVMKDEMNGEEIAVSNVVFKICHGEVRDAHDYLAFGVHGSGEAYVFTAGKVIHGTWTRTGAPDPEVNMFYDENGNEIVFNQGKTWICCVWDQYADGIKYE